MLAILRLLHQANRFILTSETTAAWTAALPEKLHQQIRPQYPKTKSMIAQMNED
jgi:hypothetical protein